jgi:hypothetical protein
MTVFSFPLSPFAARRVPRLTSAACRRAKYRRLYSSRPSLVLALLRWRLLFLSESGCYFRGTRSSLEFTSAASSAQSLSATFIAGLAGGYALRTLRRSGRSAVANRKAGVFPA